MSSPFKASPSQEASQSTARFLLKTGSEDRTICFFPSLYQLIIQRGAETEAERVDLGYAGSRLLERLLRVPGEVVPRDDLMGFAWPDRVVGQGSLNQQIYSLRQIFCDEKGRDIIQTLPRRGYQFNPAYIKERELDPAVPGETVEPQTLPAEPGAMSSPEMGEAPILPSLEPRAPESSPPFTDEAPAPGVEEPRIEPPTSRAPTRSASSWPLVALFLVTLLAGLAVSAWMDDSRRELFTREVEHGHVSMTLMAAEHDTLDTLERDSSALLQRLAALSQRPADLVLDRHDGYFKLFCQRTAADTRWLMFHQSQLEHLADEQLVQCLL